MSSKSHNPRLKNRQSRLGSKNKPTAADKNTVESTKIVYVDAWSPAMHTTFKALLSARLCAAIWSNISDCDETYNYWEPTHYLLYGSGFQTWEYSPKYAIRSYAYVLVHAIPGWLYSRLLQANKVLVFYFIRCLLGFACALCEVYFYKAIRCRFGAHPARLVLVFLVFSAGMFISGAAFLPSSFAMYFTMLALGGWFLRNYPIAILCIAMSTFLGWPFAAALGLPIALDIIVFQKQYGVFLKWTIFSLIVILVPIVTIDSLFYDKLVIAPLNIVLYNVFSTHGPNIYGVEPWTFYFMNGFLNFNLVFPLGLLVLPILAVQRKLYKHSSDNVGSRLSWMFAMPLYIWFLIFVTQPHKEERFLFPIYPVVCLCAAVALNSVQKICAHVFLSSSKVHYLTSTNVLAVSFSVISSLASILRILALYRGYHAPFDVYMTLGQLDSDTQHDLPINVCVGKEWYRFPNSFFLPVGWQLQFIPSEFRGQLPQQYSKGPGATAVVPVNMNDGNLEETTRYVDIKHCHYLIDLDTGEATPREPRYARHGNWTLVYNTPFLVAHRSHRILRAFYVPFLSEVHCNYANYQLLKSAKPVGKQTSRQ